MSERNLDFDALIDRRGTDSIKFDAAAQRGMPDDLLSYWVADMDFRVSSYVQDALAEVVAHGIFGYSEPDERYFHAVQKWMRERHDFEVTEDRLVKTPGIVYALAQAVRAFTREGDAVLIQQPVYYPFSEVTKSNNRRLVSSDLVIDASGRYHIDFDDFERKILENEVKLFIMCSPHNPVARVWRREELEKIAEICLRRGVLVISDEIHNDFDFEGRHTVFETLGSEVADITITCTAPSKTFNLAGLQCSNLFITNPRLRAQFCAALRASGYCELNPMGLAATRAAYEHGGEWRDAMMKYVEANIDFAVDFINDEIPGVSTVKNEGTYLMWLDCRELGLSVDALDELIVHKAKLWLDSGRIFGAPGNGFQRVNVACPRSYLALGLRQLRDAVLARR